MQGIRSDTVPEELWMEAHDLILWPRDAKTQLIGKTLMAGKDCSNKKEWITDKCSSLDEFPDYVELKKS